MLRKLEEKLSGLKTAGLLRRKRIAQSPTQTRQSINNHDNSISTEKTLFCSNDYLSLASHPEVIAALKDGIDKWGGGSGASHLISGHMAPHEELENMISQLFSGLISDNRCITFSTGYMANLAVITALAQGDCEIFSDELNHASLIDGIRLCKKTVKIFKHANYDHLAMMLNESSAELRLIVTDGVFSMDGDKADLDTLYELSEKYNAWVIVDDAHGYGVLGSNGLGSLEVTNQTSERVVLIGTLGKSAGLSGAFVVAHQTIVNFIFQTARAYIYTTAALPAISFALLKSLDLIHGDLGRDRRAQLKLLKNHLEHGLLGLKNKYPKFEVLIVESSSPIQAVVVGEAERATRLSSRLEELGFRVPGIRPPTVPKGTSRIRLTLSANHTINDVDLLLEALGSCFREEV